MPRGAPSHTITQTMLETSILLLPEPFISRKYEHNAIPEGNSTSIVARLSAGSATVKDAWSDALSGGSGWPRRKAILHSGGVMAVEELSIK